MTIQQIKSTDTTAVQRTKINAAIARVSDLDNTAENIAALASSAQASARIASDARDEIRDIIAGVEGDASDAEAAATVAASSAADAASARNAAIVAQAAAEDAASDATGAAAEAEASRVASEEAADAAEISRAAAYSSAGAALLSANDAADARDSALAAQTACEAAENSLLEWKGAWGATTAYALGDIVFSAGSSYVCVIAHTSGVWASDLAAGRWEVFAQQGASGPGSGDVLAANNGSEYAGAAAAFRANVGAAGTATATTVASGLMSSDDKTKLNGIEAGADVTDAANVAAAGAVMDGDFSANGVMVRTGSGAYASRQVSAGAGIAVTNPTGAGGDIAIALSAGAQASLEKADSALQPGYITAAGAAPIFGVRAWANFYWNGSAIVIRGSGNISAITRLSAGVYQINFATPMPSANYALVGLNSSGNDSLGDQNGMVTMRNSDVATMSAAQCRITTSNSYAGDVRDTALVSFIVIA